MVDAGEEEAPLLSSSPSNFPTAPNTPAKSPQHSQSPLLRASNIAPSCHTPSSINSILKNFSHSQSLPSFLDDHEPSSSKASQDRAIAITSSQNTSQISFHRPLIPSSSQEDSLSYENEHRLDKSLCSGPPQQPLVCNNGKVGTTFTDCKLEKISGDNKIEAPQRPNSLTSCSSVDSIETNDDSTLSDPATRTKSKEPIKVTFRIQGDEDTDEENPEENRFFVPDLLTTSTNDRWLSFYPPALPPNNKASFISTTSSNASSPFCRICHLPDGEGVEGLISPCRCAGTMKFIHHGCLMKWLEVSSSRSKQCPTCELCNYPFQLTTKFRIREWQWPSVSPLDRVLHITFLCCFLLMFLCSVVTVACFKKEEKSSRAERAHTELTFSEMLTLTCGLVFFVSFFVAMYVEVKAKDSLYRLCANFYYLNQTIHIYDYDKRKDSCKNASV